jgi:lipoyl(octanoyl) transferase
VTTRGRLHAVWLGRRRYAPVLALQERLHRARVAGAIEDTVLLLEHEPVITLGKRADDDNVLLPQEVLAARGIDVVRTTRGGDVTLHAPGQLVGYPIVDLGPDRRDVRRYVKDLATVMAELARAHGVSGGEAEGKVGFWVDRASPGVYPGDQAARDLAKLGAIGVRISRWVTMHGFALNLTTDVGLFSLIVPCGIRHFGVTSIQELTSSAPQVRTEAERAHRALAAVLDLECAPLSDWSSRHLPVEPPESESSARLVNGSLELVGAP